MATLSAHLVIGERVTVDQIADRHAEWSRQLEELAGEEDHD
jgi:hypothetical protein